MEHQRFVTDYETRKYIRKIRKIQFLVILTIIVLFVIFTKIITAGNIVSVKKTALAEVQESMQEAINNVTIHMESIRTHTKKNGTIAISDLTSRIKKDGIHSLNDLLSHMDVSEENRIGQAIEAIYTAKDGSIYYVNAFERTVTPLTTAQVPVRYQNSAVCNIFTVDEAEIILYIPQEYIDNLAKEEIRKFIHAEKYQGNQYIWVNELINMDGGDKYAIRRIHPNLVESEGEYLSTYTQDIIGNYPYQVELDGIRENGYVFHSYYFKNLLDDSIEEKYSYAQYYEPFHWIVATGETLEEVYGYSDELNRVNIQEIIVLMVFFLALFLLTTATMVKVLEKQAQGFGQKMMKQSQMIEEMYSTMSAGLMRVRMTEKETTLLSVNPRGVKLLGIENEDQLSRSIFEHDVVTMEHADAVALKQACLALTQQWESIDVDCRVTWADDSIHLLRIGNTLVDFEDDAKIIQQQFYDITEEHQQHKQELIAAEERATLDPMTQIKNKHAIEVILREQIRQAAQNNQPIAVGFVDIDNFREYNTMYGHLQGDDIIRYVAATLRDYIPCSLGRNGGDEFVFCIPQVNQQELEDAMKSIYLKLHEGIVFRESGKKIPIPCSTGIVIAQGPELNYDDVLHQSDLAMYQAKALGKNTWHIIQKGY